VQNTSSHVANVNMLMWDRTIARTWRLEITFFRAMFAHIAEVKVEELRNVTLTQSGWLGRSPVLAVMEFIPWSLSMNHSPSRRMQAIEADIQAMHAL
jgi:hypothetical protein